jgi:hypothetical protein
MTTMPDRNKVAAMRRRKIVPAECCALCNHFRKNPRDGWGICCDGNETYSHAKTGEVAPIPAHASFVCPRFMPGVTTVLGSASIEIGDYARLLVLEGDDE